jgi:hypothetical protein
MIEVINLFMPQEMTNQDILCHGKDRRKQQYYTGSSLQRFPFEIYTNLLKAKKTS